MHDSQRPSERLWYGYLAAALPKACSLRCTTSVPLSLKTERP